MIIFYYDLSLLLNISFIKLRFIRVKGYQNSKRLCNPYLMSRKGFSACKNLFGTCNIRYTQAIHT